jgi:hypothetical protein
MKLSLLSMQDLRIKSGIDWESRRGCYLNRPNSKAAIEAISTHLHQLTCLDLPDAPLDQLEWPLSMLANLKKLRALGLLEREGTLEPAAAARQRCGLPGPLSIKDAHHWLTAPDEGW